MNAEILKSEIRNDNFQLGKKKGSTREEMKAKFWGRN